MENTALAMLVARDMTIREINSARPHAPVVAGRPDRVRVERSGAMMRGRIVVAGLLRRAAEAVAPPCPPHAAAH